MYGLVNRAIQELVVERFGAQTWAQIAERAGLDEPVFLSHQGYRDSLTYDLVASASEVLDLAPELVLREFGRYWIAHTGRVGYADLIAGCGSTLGEFLENLPGLHTRVLLAFPELTPPEFSTLVDGEGSARIEYWSDRPGLAPMVEGLLEGLGELFGQEVVVQAAPWNADGHAVFTINWAAREAAA